MNREQQKSIISLARLDDWQNFTSYVESAMKGIGVNAMLIDPNDSITLARMQGSYQAFANILSLEESAHNMNKQEDNDE